MSVRLRHRHHPQVVVQVEDGHPFTRSADWQPADKPATAARKPHGRQTQAKTPVTVKAGERR